MNGNENCDDRGPRIGSEGVPRCHRPKGHDGEHRAAVEDGWGDVRWSNLTRPVTAPLSQDPADVTDGDRAKAAEVLKSHRVISMDVGLDRAIAAALAAERAAVARPVLALAEEAKRASTYNDWHAIAARLSAVAVTLGETGGGQ